MNYLLEEDYDITPQYEVVNRVDTNDRYDIVEEIDYLESQLERMKAGFHLVYKKVIEPYVLDINSEILNKLDFMGEKKFFDFMCRENKNYLKIKRNLDNLKRRV